MAFYLNLFSPDTWEAFQKRGAKVSGFRPRQFKQAQRIELGDILLCYLVGLSRWCGALRVTSKVFEDRSPIFADPDPFTVRFTVEPMFLFDAVHAVPVFLDEIWNKLSLTKDITKGTTGWAVGFRGSLRSLPEADGQLILSQLAKHAEARSIFELDDRDKRQLARRLSVPSPKGDILIEVPEDEAAEDAALSPVQIPIADEPEDLRQSLLIQAALAKLGSALGFDVWIAPGDRKKVADCDGVDIACLLDRLPLSFEGATLRTIEQIDVIWIKGRNIARAFEVEHTTAIYSGLLRMADLLALQPNLAIPFHIVAPDEKRDKVLREIRRPVFSLLDGGPLYDACTYISYSALNEIMSLKHLAHMTDGILEEYEEHADEVS